MVLNLFMKVDNLLNLRKVKNVNICCTVILRKRDKRLSTDLYLKYPVSHNKTVYYNLTKDLSELLGRKDGGKKKQKRL